MATLVEEETFEPGIYQLEMTDPVQGGPNGIDNLQAKQLANRTKWLKAAIDVILGSTFVAAKALKLANARNIGGVSFDGSSNINLPGVNTEGNQNTSGNAATATKLANARTINGISFDGSQDITIQIDSVVAGSVIYLAKNTAPTGYLKANGAAVSRTTYANLFAAIGTTFGAGDGSTTFNLPDLRGEFLRAWDDSRGIDTGRVFGSWQADEIKTHNHRLQNNIATGLYTFGGSVFGAGTGTSAAAYTQSTGYTETRPRNIALLACIKY